jgi:hypothetical protein
MAARRYTTQLPLGSRRWSMPWCAPAAQWTCETMPPTPRCTWLLVSRAHGCKHPTLEAPQYTEFHPVESPMPAHDPMWFSVPVNPLTTVTHRM